MRRAALALFVVIAQLAFAAPASAQDSAPGPEIQRLGYYVGTWRGEGETRGGPFGPAGRLSSTMSCEWFAGGFQVVCRGQENGPTGTRQFLNLRSYDPSAHTYTEYSISSMGETEYTTGGTMVGNTRTFLTHVDMGGRPVQIRYVEELTSPTRYTYRAEASVDGGAWEVIAEGAVTKVH